MSVVTIRVYVDGEEVTDGNGIGIPRKDTGCDSQEIGFITDYSLLKWILEESVKVQDFDRAGYVQGLIKKFTNATRLT